MFFNKIKAPFQHEKIPLEKLEKNRPDNLKRAQNASGTIKRIWQYLSIEKFTLVLVILMVVLSSAMSLLGPYMIGIAIDNYIEAKLSDGIGRFLIILIFIFLLHSIAIFLQNFWMIGIAQNTVFKLRADLFNKFHHLPISYFDNTQQGELMSRVTNDIDNINNTLNQSVIQIFASVLTLIGTVSVMLALSPLLTLITMTIIPLMFISMRWITKRTGPLYKMQQQNIGALNGYIEEIFSGQEIVKTFSQEHRVIDEFSTHNKKLRRSAFWSMVFTGFIPKIMNLLNFLSFGLIALFGGILAIKGVITVGVILIFTEYARQFTRPLNELSNQFNVLLSAIAGAERVFAVLDEESEEIDEKDAIELKETNGHFEFKNVTFAYEETPTLKNLSFEVKPGQTIAFVGHTGAGKSTIINLLSRFYNYDDGKILLDGKDIKDITRSSLRSHMAFVLQDPFLFKGTIRENIRYGRLNATDEEVITAAKNANAHDYIVRMPDGYDTMLDQDGSGISSGQRQLLTIARAMIAEPSILILDEATSNIDTITELKIQDALTKLMSGRTSFVIAHRLNTIKEADEIIMLENGEMIEYGTHEELINQGGDYFDLYQGQLDELTP